MRRRHLRAAAAVVVFLARSAAGATLSAGDQLNVFLDCTDCFEDYMRTTVSFVAYVRDPSEAHVHVLVTREPTGSGGRELTIKLLGLGPFRGIDQTLKYAATASDSEDHVRRGLATTLTIGLLRYLAGTAAVDRLAVSVALDSTGTRYGAQPADAWRNWVFSLRSSASLDAEESSRELELGVLAGADRVTPTWKVSIAGEIEYNAERFDLDEDEPVLAVRTERELRWLVVRSLGEHWSAGTIGSLQSSTFRNTALAVHAAPAIEYNVFPYSDYTRRRLRILYSVGGGRARYVEETLFGRFNEALAQQQLSVTLEEREPWGSLLTRAEFWQYLHDASKHRLELFGDLSFRVARGLSLNVEATASRVRDQLSLPRRGATAEEVLLRQRQLRSDYEYELAVGFTYSFGSIYSSIVNPRFGR